MVGSDFTLAFDNPVNVNICAGYPEYLLVPGPRYSSKINLRLIL